MTSTDAPSSNLSSSTSLSSFLIFSSFFPFSLSSLCLFHPRSMIFSVSSSKSVLVSTISLRASRKIADQLVVVSSSYESRPPRNLWRGRTASRSRKSRCSVVVSLLCSKTPAALLVAEWRHWSGETCCAALLENFRSSACHYPPVRQRLVSSESACP
jgi:hypothetical protein